MFHVVHAYFAMFHFLAYSHRFMRSYVHVSSSAFVPSLLFVKGSICFHAYHMLSATHYNLSLHPEFRPVVFRIAPFDKDAVSRVRSSIRGPRAIMVWSQPFRQIAGGAWQTSGATDHAFVTKTLL